MSVAIEQGSAQAINYFIAQKYVEAVGKFATSPNAKTILFPVEATQLIGTLGGIGALTREALGDHATMPPAPTAPPSARGGREAPLRLLPALAQHPAGEVVGGDLLGALRPAPGPG